MKNRRESLRGISAEVSVGLLTFCVRFDVAGVLLGVAVVVDAYEQKVVDVLRHLGGVLPALNPAYSFFAVNFMRFQCFLTPLPLSPASAE